MNTNPKKRISLKNFLLHPWLKIDNYNNKPKANLNIFTKAEQIIYEESNQNIQTISFVFTPYNTRREKDEDDDLYYDDVNIEDDIIKYIPKAQEISRLYEIHNNWYFDRGYIVGRKQMWKKKNNGFYR